MTTVAERLGGREAMRRRFLAFEENEWFVPESLIDRVFALVGWKREPTG
jgi:hypothetical protein